MAELPLKEGRLPELRLPEISREDILRTFSDIKRPDIDLKAVEWPKVDLSNLEITRDDVDKAIAGVTAAARLARPAARSSRWPVAIGFVIVAALATFAVLSRPAVRDRLAQASADARRKAEDMRRGPEMLEVEADLGAAVDEAAAVAIPIEADAFSDAIEPVEARSKAALEEVTAGPA